MLQSAKPLIFISYAHADEPEKPRGEEVHARASLWRGAKPSRR
jgi:hypothetical protein